MANESAYPPVVAVAREVSRWLTERGTRPSTYVPDRWLTKSWSTIYFLRGVAESEGSRLVVKIARFPDQRSASLSWTSPELIARGQREFRCLERVAGHFQSAPEELEAVQPVAYVDGLNAIVMEQVEGHPIWSGELHPGQLMREGGVAKAERRLRLAGEWLRWLHAIRLDESPAGRELSSTDSLQHLFARVMNLEGWGIHLRSWPDWAGVERILHAPGHGDGVWLHGDYHPGNLWVLAGGGVLGLDTALEGHGSPYEDLGKFIVSLRTRRLRVLFRGVFPPQGILSRLEGAFLRGYFQGSACDERMLRLHEGRYLFEKWTEGLTALRTGLPESVSRLAARLLVNPAYCQFAQEWMGRVLRLPEECGR